MLKSRIIPCLDVKNGRVVKGINFVDLKDAGDPVEQAKIYSDSGADEICFLDITASNENRDTIYEVVKKTSAVQNPEVVIESSKKFGSQCIVVAIDAKKNGDMWEIFTHGGRNKTGINALEFAKKMEKNGAGELLVTSMDKDGTQTGYDIELMKNISSSVNIPVIASGGVGTLDHMVDGIKSGANAVLAASIFHYGTFSIEQAKQYLASKNIPVRI